MVLDLHNYRIKYFLAVLLLFSSTGTVPLFSEMSFLGLLCGIVMFFFFGYGHKIGSSYIGFVGLLFIYSAGYFVQFSTFNPVFTLRTFILVTTSYMVIKILGFSLIHLLDRIVYRLAFLSLIFYTWQILNFGSLYAFIGLIERLLPFGDFGGDRNVGIVIFVVKDYAMMRNSGFAWEPGAFAAFLSFPLLFSLVNSNFRINRKSIVLLLALITTFSTMGYLVLISLVIYFYLYHSISNRTSGLTTLLAGFFVALLVFFIFQQDFMSNKVVDELNQTDVLIDNANRDLGSSKELYSLGRIASLKLDFIDFLRYPVFGFGGQDEDLSKSQYYILNRNNGWGQFFRTFGLVGVLVLLYNLYRTGQFFQRAYNIRFLNFFFITIFFIFTFSNGIIMSPLMIGYQWFPILVKKINYTQST